MPSSAVPHVINFLTQPLFSISKTPLVNIAAADSILNLMLPASSAVFTLTSTSDPPDALLAASVGAGVPWPSWFAALGGATGRDIFLFYGPGYFRICFDGEAPVTDVWCEEEEEDETQESVDRRMSTVDLESNPAVLESNLAALDLKAVVQAGHAARARRGWRNAETARFPPLPAVTTAADLSSYAESESDTADSNSSSLSSPSSLSSSSTDFFSSSVGSEPSPNPATLPLPTSRPPATPTTTRRRRPHVPRLLRASGTDADTSTDWVLTSLPDDTEPWPDVIESEIAHSPATQRYRAPASDRVFYPPYRMTISLRPVSAAPHPHRARTFGNGAVPLPLSTSDRGCPRDPFDGDSDGDSEISALTGTSPARRRASSYHSLRSAGLMTDRSRSPNDLDFERSLLPPLSAHRRQSFLARCASRNGLVSP